MVPLDAWPGSGLSTRSAFPLPHHDVRDGPRYVSKRNSSENDCRAHIAVVLMSHVPVDAPAASQQRISLRPLHRGHHLVAKAHTATAPSVSNERPLRHIACKITASLRATATFARLNPIRSRNFRPQRRSALSVLARVRICAAASYR